MDRERDDRLTRIGVAALSIFPITFAAPFFVMLAAGILPPWIFAIWFERSIVAVGAFHPGQSRRRPEHKRAVSAYSTSAEGVFR